MNHGSPTVLLVGDDDELQECAHAVLAAEGIGPIGSLGSDGDLAGYLAHGSCELVLLDLGSQAQGGARLVSDLTSNHPGVTVVVLADADQLTYAAACVHQGAYDHLTKPLEPSRIASVVRRALGMQRLRRAPPAPRPGGDEALREIVTADPAMRSIFAYVRSIASSGQPVLILGETGTGKDLVARALHALSGRAGSYAAVNLAGMDDNLLTDSLFGHRRGAFTGANDIRPGLVLRASAGTLFLDEIGELSLVSQVKLLRLLQDGDYYPLGSDQPKCSTARVVAASSANLRRLKASGQFRSDLYFRLCAHVIELPPLRDRMGDLPLLMRHFAGLAAAELARPALEIDPELIAMLAGYSFPGNVRELRSLVYDAVCRTPPGGRLSRAPFEQALAQAHGEEVAEEHAAVGFPAILPTASQMQELLLAEALRRTGGNQSQAAAMLGLTRQAIHKRLHK